MGLAVWQWMLPLVSGRVTTVGTHFHMFARSHSRRFQTSQVGQLLCLFLYANVRAVLTYTIVFFLPKLSEASLPKLFAAALGLLAHQNQTLSSVSRWHHKQLSFYTAFSLIHRAFPSTVPPFAPWFFSDIRGLCLLSHAAESLERTNLSVAALNPFLSLLVFMNIKWDLPGACIKLFNSSRSH